VGYLHRAVPGAATGASTEAACPDRKAYRTALGSRCCGCRRPTRSGAEQRAKTTVVTTLAAAQNGTSGVLAVGKQLGIGRLAPRREPALLGYSSSSGSRCGGPPSHPELLGLRPHRLKV
jgi:hypothetical protein